MPIALLPSPRRRQASPATPIMVSRRVVIVVAIACATGIICLASLSHPVSRRAVWSPIATGKGSDTSAGDDVYGGAHAPAQGQEGSGAAAAADTLWHFRDPVGWFGDRLKSSDRKGNTRPSSTRYSSYSSSSSPHAEAGSYRQHLEATTSPPAYKHSRTLTFSHIYVLSLQSRKDRRARMKKLAHALDIDITFVDAVVKSEGVIRWIGERVEEIRQRKAVVLAKAYGKKPSQIGGLTPGSLWLTRSDGQGPSALEFPSLKEERWGGLTWLEYLNKHGPENLDASTGAAFDVTQRLHDPLENIANRQLNEGSLAVWYGQTNVMRQMLANGDESALILEDDVDFEWDLERLWASVHQRLPVEEGTSKADWLMAFLGHCWGRETLKSQYKHPLLHQSSEPRCLHAYALTSNGAKRILELLSDPWVAYQTAVDIAIPTFIRDDLLGATGAFSVDPQLIVQAKELTSDVAPGIGSPWRGWLMDSTWERVLRDEGQQVPEPIFVTGRKADPAIQYRGALSNHPDLDAEADWLADVAEQAAQRKADQAKAREDTFAREVLVPGVNLPAKAPTKKWPAPAVGKAGANAAHAGGLLGSSGLEGGVGVGRGSGGGRAGGSRGKSGGGGKRKVKTRW